MKFATWNVHKGLDGAGKSNQPAIILNVLLREPEFLALQEVPSQEWLAYVAAACTNPQKHMSHYFAQTHANGSGIGLLTQHMSTVTTHQFQTSCMVSDTRSVLIARPIYVPNLVVMCTHFSAHASMTGQTSQATQLATLVDETSGDVVVMGDLNSHHASPALTKLREVGVRDMWRSAAVRERGYWRGCTFPTMLPLQRIDYVLARSDYLISESAYTFDANKASDHKCLLVNISGIV